MEKYLKLIALLLAVVLVLPGCMASSGGDGESVPPETEGSSAAADESSEAELAAFSYTLIDVDYPSSPHNETNFADTVICLIRSVEELAKYCGGELPEGHHDEAFFENNSLLIICSTYEAYTGLVDFIGDIVEDDDGNIVIEKNVYYYCTGGMNGIDRKCAVFEINRHPEQATMNLTRFWLNLEQYRAKLEEYDRRNPPIMDPFTEGEVAYERVDYKYDHGITLDEFIEKYID